jgi:hypothetical protein
VVLLVRSFVLLRFRAPRYEELDRGCSVTWPIVDGLLVSREGRGRGFLRLSIERADSSEASAGPSLTVTMEVKDFLPSIRASGRLAWLGTRVYALTQGHLHRVTTRRFLRSLARVDLSK